MTNLTSYLKLMVAGLALALLLALSSSDVRADGKAAAPDRDALIKLGTGLPYGAKLDVAGNVDDILSHKPSRVESEVMLIQAYYETGLGRVVLGDCRCPRADGSVDDCPDAKERTIAKCSSYGIMQTVRPGDWVPGATPAKVIADRRLGYEVGLAVFRYCMKACGGDVKAALGKYFTGGACGSVPDKVAVRCKHIGC